MNSSHAYGFPRSKMQGQGMTSLVPAGPEMPPAVRFRPRMPMGQAADARDAAPIRQRAKLWELNSSIHCSIVGTCLSTAELRRLMGKIAQRDVSDFSDHELHGDAVRLCAQHNSLSKLLQKALDLRHQLVVKQFARLKSEAALMEKWGEARRSGDIPGAYWAVVTHPDVGQAGTRQAFGDIHMLSHLVGAANRADIRRLAALEAENAALADKITRQQACLHEASLARETTIRSFGLVAAPDLATSETGSDPDRLRAFHHLVAGLQDRLAREAARNEHLERRIAEASATGRQWEQKARDAGNEHAAVLLELKILEQSQETSANAPDAAKACIGLPTQKILYVGGRPGCVRQIRNLMQAAGGELLCHDGGRDDHPSLLPGLISQADRVAFPVDCVSHDAALTVKRFCRQFGKAWLPLRSSGLASFLAAVAEQGASRSILVPMDG